MSNYRLLVEKGKSKGRHLRLKTNGQVVVGRDMSNNLRISDPQTSRRHFQIESKLGEYVLKDLGSSNGTFVNGSRVQSTQKLESGDKIAIGDTLVYFLQESEEDAANRRGELTDREIAGYRIGRLLGRGGMGTVYEAVQISLERKVAFKVLSPEFTDNPEFIERFISEARAAGRLNHANIVSVFDVGQQEDLYFYSMEYMAGGSVDDLIRKEKKLDIARTIPIVFDAARGLEYAEKQGLIHRDIKPDNLMLGADEVVKISDLGLAIFTSRQHDVSGSPHYIAPEQALGKDIDHRADLYALGVTWYQLLSGNTPFEGSSPQQIARKHVEETAPPLREVDVPEDVVAVVDALMAKDPTERLPSARQLQADLAELARRYPVRETILLRIDAVAPDDLPTIGMADTYEGPVPAMSAHASWIILGLLAIVLLFAAYGVTSAVMGGKADRQKRARDDLAKVQALLDEGKLVQAAAEAGELAERLEAEGLSELADEAIAIGKQASQTQAEGDAKRVNAEAAGKLKTARELLQQHGAAPLTDPAVRSRLEEVRRILDRIIEDYPKAPAAVEAQETRNEVNRQLAKVGKAERELNKRREEARKALTRTQHRIKGLLKETTGSRFKIAADAAREFIKDYGDLQARGGQTLLRQVEVATRRAVQRHTQRAYALIAQSEWSEAEAELAKVNYKLGFVELEKDVASALRTLQERREKEVRDKQRKREEADWRRYDAAVSSTRADLDKRNYSNAASKLRSEVITIKTATPRRLAKIRMRRLRGAAMALERLAAHVKAGKAGVMLEVEFTGAGRARARAVKYQPLTRTYTFRHPKKRGFERDVQLTAINPSDLLGFFKAIQLTSEQKIELACLAYELGRKPEAAAILEEVRSLGGSLKREADDLMFLDGFRR